ncbi:hypothetical protein LshimejAT787_0405220 [Lyophyllum shimeji]|uniref:Uncharacterized protein n=1 Tax=Lyophyllum shimeji TaxID=47721 RepID=A0A9P3PLE5_LYOSH|nr:hypothetical protein LshimejAT787_0404930 [Lyophyllum shimeji]GLB37468.1 hypothetical protein LshimejAT787_0405190 [Lyophyllum shimeji]GLB37471.1 hypothetical protein LshimejAT787_0405220 [Lyophyllum shimeji]
MPTSFPAAAAHFRHMSEADDALSDSSSSRSRSPDSSRDTLHTPPLISNSSPVSSSEELESDPAPHKHSDDSDNSDLSRPMIFERHLPEGEAQITPLGSSSGQPVLGNLQGMALPHDEPFLQDCSRSEVEVTDHTYGPSMPPYNTQSDYLIDTIFRGSDRQSSKGPVRVDHHRLRAAMLHRPTPLNYSALHACRAARDSIYKERALTRSKINYTKARITEAQRILAFLEDCGLDIDRRLKQINLDISVIEAAAAGIGCGEGPARAGVSEGR